jgi:serine/tyrosine/threonine adenylyltransferase
VTTLKVSGAGLKERAMKVHIPFDNSYVRLPGRFFEPTAPTPVDAPRLIEVNHELARLLRIDPSALESADGVEVLAGNRVPEGAEPIATAYAGHQFGHFVPQLGDGRAILLGEVVGTDGVRRDIQLKGAGRTRFSRGGDGRSAIGPVLREYIVSEGMAALGIPTTRALAAVATGEEVYREVPLPGAVLTRVARSHIRIGTFQFFASRSDHDAVRALADHVIARHYPDAAAGERSYLTLFEAIVAAQADLIAQWLLIGFIHGVMNTDNMSVAGETIDFGPCAFMDEYHPMTVFSSIDQRGRYAWGNQPRIGEWNLARLAECLLPLIHDDGEQAVEDATTALATYGPRLDAAHARGMRRKLGLLTERGEDVQLAADLLKVMGDNGADYTLTFRRLNDAAVDGERDVALRGLFIDAAAIDSWLVRWRERLAAEGVDAQRRDVMRTANPAFIPRNHQVERIIRAAIEDGDFAPFREMLGVVTRPFDEQPEHARYAEPPQEHERVRQTFCGT